MRWRQNERQRKFAPHPTSNRLRIAVGLLRRVRRDLQRPDPTRTPDVVKAQQGYMLQADKLLPEINALLSSPPTA